MLSGEFLLHQRMTEDSLLEVRVLRRHLLQFLHVEVHRVCGIPCRQEHLIDVPIDAVIEEAANCECRLLS